MDSPDNGRTGTNKLEIRFFGQLMTIAEQKGWSFPCFYELERECSALELVERMGIPADLIEGVFVNGLGKPLDKGWIKPGDRVGFIPYGIPGPYRVHFGFFREKAKK